MKNAILSVFAALLCILPLRAQSDKSYEWTDATTLTIGGKLTSDTSAPYSRLPESLKDKTTPKIWELGQSSSGIYVKFRSDAPEFVIRWSLGKQMGSSVMSRINYMGLDLYYWDGARWKFAYPCKPGSRADEQYETICTFDRLPAGEREYMLYLSMYNAVKTLQIGVEKPYSLAASRLDNPKSDRPVVMYGTSILQGGSASRPGLASTNRISRELGRTVINLGFAGNGRLNLEIAEYMASCPNPALYVLDNAPNCSDKLIADKQEAFFRILRNAHPDVPVVFIENPMYPKTDISEAEYRRFAPRNEMLRKVYDSLVAKGEKNIWYIPAEGLLDPEKEGTIDGTHFNEIGFNHYLSVVVPVLKAALKAD